MPSPTTVRVAGLQEALKVTASMVKMAMVSFRMRYINQAVAVDISRHRGMAGKEGNETLMKASTYCHTYCHTVYSVHDHWIGLVFDSGASKMACVCVPAGICLFLLARRKTRAYTPKAPPILMHWFLGDTELLWVKSWDIHWSSPVREAVGRLWFGREKDGSGGEEGTFVGTD